MISQIKAWWNPKKLTPQELVQRNKDLKFFFCDDLISSKYQLGSESFDWRESHGSFEEHVKSEAVELLHL